MSRIETREHAMELLFQIGFRNDPISNQIETFKENYPEVAEDEAYFLDIVYGVINSRDELDEKFDTLKIAEKFYKNNYSIEKVHFQ